MKKLILILSILLTCLFFISCSDDDGYYTKSYYSCDYFGSLCAGHYEPYYWCYNDDFTSDYYKADGEEWYTWDYMYDSLCY